MAQGGSPVPDMVIKEDVFYNRIHALEIVAKETGKSVAQVALNWLNSKKLKI